MKSCLLALLLLVAFNAFSQSISVEKGEVNVTKSILTMKAHHIEEFSSLNTTMIHFPYVENEKGDLLLFKMHEDTKRKEHKDMARIVCDKFGYGKVIDYDLGTVNGRECHNHEGWLSASNPSDLTEFGKSLPELKSFLITSKQTIHKIVAKEKGEQCYMNFFVSVTCAYREDGKKEVQL